VPVLSILEYQALKALLDSHLPERLAALEEGQRADGRPRPLGRVNAGRQAAGERLRAAVSAVMTTQADASAKHVLRALGRQGWAPLPSVRTVQRHMDALRRCDTQQCDVREC